jgi:hypothetical protein
LDPKGSLASFIFEPLVGYSLSNESRFNFALSVDRPSDPDVNIRLPKGAIHFTHDNKWGAFINFVDINSTPNARTGVYYDFKYPLNGRTSLTIQAGPYVTLGSNLTRYSGTQMGRWGLTERVGITYENERFYAQAMVTLEQRVTPESALDYATAEYLGFKIHENMSVGMVHEILSSVVDDTTSYYRASLAPGSRINQISAFATIYF